MVKVYPKVCCVMCTYGRFETVRQSVGMFLWQDYPVKELVVFNTAPTPMHLDAYLRSFSNVRIVNQPLKADGTEYQSLGDVRTASLDHAEGDVYICWDDDDFFFPWHISQGIEKKGANMAWKPEISYWSHDGGKSMKGLMGNAMEASVLVDMDVVKEHAFSLERSGGEHVDGGWYSYVSDNGYMIVDPVSPDESYAYVWGDDRSSHKTSGHIDDVNNFDSHKTASTDFGIGQELTAQPFSSLSWILESAIDMWIHRATKEKASEVGVTNEDVNVLIEKVLTYYEKAAHAPPSWMKPSVTEEQPKKEQQVSVSSNDLVLALRGVESALLDVAISIRGISDKSENETDTD